MILRYSCLYCDRGMTAATQAKEIYEMENEGTYPARLSSGGHASFRESKTFSRSGSRNASFQISHKGELLRSASRCAKQRI